MGCSFPLKIERSSGYDGTMQSVSQLLIAAAWLASVWEGLLRWRHMSSSRHMDVSLATTARAYLPSLRKIINNSNALLRWHDLCCSPAAGRFGRKKQERAAPLPFVSCAPSFVRAAIAHF